MIKSGNKSINGNAGEVSSSNFAIDSNGLGITNIPVIISLPTIRNSLDNRPGVLVQNITDELCVDRNSLICRGSIVCTSGHLNRNSGVTTCLIDIVHGDNIPAYADRNDTSVI